MLMLALGTWWLKNTLLAEGPREAAAPRSSPLHHAGVRGGAFDKQGGRLRIQASSCAATDTERIEIDQAHIRAAAADVAPRWRTRRAPVTATAASCSCSDVRVDGSGPRGEPIEFRGEFLHAF
jgi:hypothetical protein